MPDPMLYPNFFLLPFVNKIDFSQSSDDYLWKEQRLDYKIGK